MNEEALRRPNMLSRFTDRARAATGGSTGRPGLTKEEGARVPDATEEGIYRAKSLHALVGGEVSWSWDMMHRYSDFHKLQRELEGDNAFQTVVSLARAEYGEDSIKNGRTPTAAGDGVGSPSVIASRWLLPVLPKKGVNADPHFRMAR